MKTIKPLSDQWMGTSLRAVTERVQNLHTGKNEYRDVDHQGASGRADGER